MGEEITIRYSYVSLHRMLLKDVIRDAWMFECSCARCRDRYELGTQASSFTCNKCAEGFLDEVENSTTQLYYKCNQCNTALSKQEVLEKALAMRKLELSTPDIAAIPDIICDMKHYGGHALSHSIIQLKLQFIEQACMSSAACSQVLEYCRDIHQYLQALNPGLSMQRGRVLFCCSKARMLQLQKGEEKEKVEGEEVRERREILKMQILAQKMISGYVKK